MVSEPLYDYWATSYKVSAIGSPTVYIHAPSPIVLGVKGVLSSLASDVSWPGQMFISLWQSSPYKPVL
jgi:hypothetical protein